MSHERDYPATPLTEEELKYVRRMMDADNKARWFWASIRTWATWITIVVGGLTLGYDFIARVLKKIVGG